MNCFFSNNTLSAADSIFKSIVNQSFSIVDLKIVAYATAFFFGGIASASYITFSRKFKMVLDPVPEFNDLYENISSIDQVFRKINSETKTIDIRNQRIKEFPQQLMQLEHLSILNLVNAGLNRLPTSFRYLKSLKHLDLAQNFFKRIPFEVFYLKNLLHLSFRSNSLTFVDVGILNLTQLDTLDLCDNYLKDLPQAFGCLDDLIDLDLSYNIFHEIPKSIPLLKSLHLLDVSNNYISSLSQICFQSSIKCLDASNNCITKLSESLSQSYNLTSLDLHSNRIIFLGNSLDNLVSLETLSLSENQLEGLPNSFSMLANLERLDVGYNIRLNSLPLSLATIKTLQEIKLFGTSIGLNQLCALHDLMTLLNHEDQKISFEVRLKIWAQFSGITDELCLPLLQPSESADALEWLLRLEKARDFQSDQTLIAEAVIKIACKLINPSFKELFFVQISANLTDCEDRALYNLILLNIYRTLYDLDDCLKIEEFNILKRAIKSLSLPQIVYDLLLTNQKHGESTEVYLYVYTRLTDKHNLIAPYSALRMRYPDYAEVLIGRGKNPDLSDIEERLNSLPYGALLLKELPYFTDLFLTKYFKDELIYLDHQRSEQLSELEADMLNLKDSEYNAKIKLIQSEYENKKIQILNSL